MSIEDKFAIQELIACFANSFDVKDWNGLKFCFTDSVYADYSDLRGTPAETMSASEYVSARRESLDHLKLHHLVGNYEIDFPDAGQAACHASMVAWRKSEDADWKISGITQKVLWNAGTSSIHKGAKS